MLGGAVNAGRPLDRGRRPALTATSAVNAGQHRFRPAFTNLSAGEIDRKARSRMVADALSTPHRRSVSMGITPNRLVTVLTPLVFAPLAGTISVLAAKHFPGIDIDSDHVQQVFIAGALIAFGKAGLWLKGWQDWEKAQDVVPEDVVNDAGLEASIDGGFEIPADVDDEAALADGLDPDDEEDDADFDDEALPDDDGLAIVGRD
jgi:hypothetical protein